MNRSYIAVLMIVLFSTAVFAQKQKKGPEIADPPQGRSAGKKADPAIAAGTTIQGTLQSAVDVRKSQVGDSVIVKTTQAVKQNGEVIIPKGSKVVGKITEISRGTGQQAGSRISMVFERLEGKNIDIPLTAQIVSIANTQASSALNADVFDMSTSTSTSTRSSAGASGGGLLGGVGNTVGGVGNTVGGVVNTTTSTVGNVAGSATDTVGSTAGSVGSTVRGLSISGSASGAAGGSSTISSGNKNLRLDKGVTVLLSVNSTQNN